MLSVNGGRFVRIGAVVGLKRPGLEGVLAAVLSSMVIVDVE